MRTEKLALLILLLGLLQGCVTVDPGKGKNEKASAVNVQLGIGYLQQNKLELASEKLSKALRQDPNSASAHNAYGILQDRLLSKPNIEPIWHHRLQEVLGDDSGVTGARLIRRMNSSRCSSDWNAAASASHAM